MALHWTPRPHRTTFRRPMPEAPKIFLSAASSDLQSARVSASAALRALGWQPIVADHSEPDSGAFWQQIQPVMRECGAVVHMVGFAYGNEPSQRLAAEPRRSYSQLEYDLAIALRRPLIVFLCDERFPFDSRPAEDVEEQRLQQTHRTFLQSQGRSFQFVNTLADLDVALREQCPAPMAARLPVRPPPPTVRVPEVAEPQRSTGRPWLLIVGAFAALVLVTAIAATGVAMFIRDRILAPRQVQLAPPAPEPVPAASLPPVDTHPPKPATPASTPRPPVTTVAPVPAPRVAEPPPALAPAIAPSPIRKVAEVPAAPVIDSSLVNSTIRTEVQRRIAIAPDIPEEKKDRVSEMVARAKEMRRVIILPFETGDSRIPTDERTQLLTLLDSPDFAGYRDDLTCVFVVLGFADTRGSNSSNLHLSAERARRVREFMQHDGAIKNVIHPVGMGETTLLDDHQLEKNRIAEIWAVRL